MDLYKNKWNASAINQQRIGICLLDWKNVLKRNIKNILT